METCDVLVVGGGPAGSSCAGRLVKAGLDVLVLDKKLFPRDKPCAGWITPPVVEALRLDLADYQKGRVLEPITGFITGLMGGPEVESSYPKPISYGIRRFEFDDYLLQRTGARLRLGEAMRSIEPVNGGWLVNGTIQARMLVGAGGHFCPVARFFDPEPRSSEVAITAQEIEVELTPAQMERCPIRPGIPYLYFCRDLKGYGWFYRKGSFLNVGLGREGERKIAEQTTAFVESLKEQGKIPRDLSHRVVGHAYVLYGQSLRPLVGDHLLLVGDATGMAYSPSGEGIRPAVETGLLAADAIQAAEGDYRLARLEPYQRKVTARFGTRPARSVSDMIPGWLKKRLAVGLFAWPWFSRRYLVERWFLRMHEPALTV